jgi:DNA-binding IclR family transcriptional regulator
MKKPLPVAKGHAKVAASLAAKPRAKKTTALPVTGKRVGSSRGIQSVEVGGQLLMALVRHGRVMPLKDLAQGSGMTPAKAHPYLVSFGKIGLIEQDDASGRYGLGPLAIQLGLIGLQQVDPVKLASAELPLLAQRVGHTVAIAVWGNLGPTIIRIEEGPNAIHVNMRLGTTVSVRGTASGMLFAALFQPDSQVRDVLAREEAEGLSDAAWDDQTFQADLARIRQSGISVLTDSTVRGVSAIAAPVFDGLGRIALALVAIGPNATLDTRAGGAPCRALRAAAEAVSRQLGAGGPANRA